MKALTIRQPWAWAITHGYKKFENRTWQTSYRGPLLIHAGRRFDQEGLDWIKATFPNLPMPEQFQQGGFVGMCKLVDVVTESASPWFFGPFGFVLSDVQRVEFIPWRGQLRIFSAWPQITSIGGVTNFAVNGEIISALDRLKENL